MTRSSRTPRRLDVDGDAYLWSVTHEHHEEHGAYAGCQEVLTFRRPGAIGRLRVVFAAGPDCVVPDGRIPSGTVGTATSGTVNLHEPGTARTLLTALTSRGDRVPPDTTREINGWPLLHPPGSP